MKIQSLLLLLFWLPVSAQITFRTADIPGQIGTDFWRTYAEPSDKDVSTLLGPAGGPHRWDFSYPKDSGEIVNTTSIVAPTDGGHGAAFIQAAHAERETRDSDGCQSWSYFKITPGSGRLQYGLYDACKLPQPAIVFSNATIDLPENLTMGTSWQQEVDWTDVLDLGIAVVDIALHLSSQSTVDAFGSVVLPGIGELPALRVNEVNTYQTTELTFGILLEDQIYRNYYWLVPGIGRAVHIISPPGTSAPPVNFPIAKTILRVFESSRYPVPARQPVINPQMEWRDNKIYLFWEREATATGYEIESALRLGGEAQWTLLASGGDNFHTDADVGSPYKFYRIFWRK